MNPSQYYIFRYFSFFFYLFEYFKKLSLLIWNSFPKNCRYEISRLSLEDNEDWASNGWDCGLTPLGGAWETRYCEWGGDRVGPMWRETLSTWNCDNYSLCDISTRLKCVRMVLLACNDVDGRGLYSQDVSTWKQSYSNYSNYWS